MTSDRALMNPVGKIRAYFAPVDRGTGQAAGFDAGKGFDVDAPVAPWVDLGSVKNFVRKTKAELESVRTGMNGLVSVRYRKSCDARVEFDFCEWGKLQMALAASSQHINLLAEDGGGKAIPALRIGNGSSANEILLSADALAGFAVGDLAVVDVDLENETGYVGTGVAGAYVKSASGLDNDYVRRVTFNVARIAEKTDHSLKLESRLVGGVPKANAGIQKVAGFIDREGASFLQQWSALFVMEAMSGGQVVFYYPKLETAAEAGETSKAIDGEIEQLALRAKFVALPETDLLDGEQVVCYRSYFPAAGAPAY